MQKKFHIRQLVDLGRLYLLPGTLLALTAGIASYSELNTMNGLRALFTAILMNYIFFSPNDIYDTESDRKNQRKDSWMGGVIERRSFPKAVAFASIGIGYLTALYIRGTFGLTLAAVTTASLLYSVPPVRLKTRPPLDSAVNGLGVFMIFSTGVAIAGGTLQDVIPGAYWFSAIAAGYHVILAVPDIEADREAGIKTTAMYLGRKGSVMLTQILIITALVFEKWSSITQNFLVIQFLGLFMMWKDWNDDDMNRLILFGVLVLVTYLGFYSLNRGL